MYIYINISVNLSEIQWYLHCNKHIFAVSVVVQVSLSLPNKENTHHHHQKKNKKKKNSDAKMRNKNTALESLVMRAHAHNFNPCRHIYLSSFK